MLDSLSQFLDISKELKFQGQKTRISLTNPNTPKKFNNHSTLVYSTQKSKTNACKGKFGYQKSKFQQSGSVKENSKSIEDKREMHWVQRNNISENFLKPQHKLLKAIIKTRQYESTDHEKTAYDKSLGRIVSAYSKIKTKPIQFWFPPKMPQIRKNEQSGDKKLIMRNQNSGQQKKILNLQNSIKWAKKHGKNPQIFEKEMLKSFDKLNNLQLNKRIQNIKKEEVKIQQQKRRSARLDFKNKLKQKQAKYIMTKQLQERLNAIKKQHQDRKDEEAINNLFQKLFHGHA